MYVIQGIMSDILICMELSVDEESKAIIVAKGLLNDPTFEGDSVRVITRDSELVWGPFTKESMPS